MKPIEFPEQTDLIAKDQDEYQTLPARITDDGQVISCWQLSFKERMRLLFTGKLWLSVWTFGSALQPLYPTTKKEELVPSE